jgi:TolA-binding protein
MESEQESSYLLDKKIEYLINMKTGKLQSQLEQANSRLAEMEQTISTLKNKVQRLNSGVAVQQTLMPGSSNNFSQSPSTGKKEVKKEETTNSRTGNFSTDDVSIEKMFYFGNKN